MRQTIKLAVTPIIQPHLMVRTVCVHLTCVVLEGIRSSFELTTSASMESATSRKSGVLMAV